MMESNEMMQTGMVSRPQEEEGIQLGDLLRRCLARWWWFAVSLVVCLAVAALYILRTTPEYSTSAELQIKSDSKGSSIPGDMGDFSNMGFLTMKSNVNNELRAFQSPDLMSEVVERLRLHMNYTVEGLFHPTVLYGSSLPFEAKFLDVEENVSAGMTVTPSRDGSLSVGLFRLKGKKVAGGPVHGSMGDTLVTPVGRVTLWANKNYTPAPASSGRDTSVVKAVMVRKSGMRAVTQSYLRGLQVSLADKRADVITLGIKDVSTQRSQDVLNTLIAVYNENWVKDKNQVANATSVFINDRLRVIESELAGVDSDISTYKSENMIPDVESAAKMYMERSTVISQQMQDVGNQLYMARYIRDYINNEANRFQPLPANMGLTSQTVEGGITEYNTKLLQRNNLVANSGESNVLVKDMDQALASMRGAVLRSVENEIMALQTRYDNLEGTSRQNTARIAANPNQAKRLLSVERQQAVKQSLYLFLLQKREENELSQAFTAYNTRILKHPISGILPVAPQSAKILLVALLLGLALPIGIIYVLAVSDTKIRSRKDLQGLTLPFLGEIPQSGAKSGRGLLRKGAIDENLIVVRQGSRNVVNEAFRVMRTNLEFMTADSKRNVIAVTSFNPGSGKSFMTKNLAVCLAIKGRRVLMIDGDLRHASLSTFVGSPKRGLSDYLTGRVADVKEVVVPSPEYPTLDTIPVGTIPPNPAELIADPRMAKAVEELRASYDYVFIDCPPINIVTDARIINRLVDRTVFVVRAGLLEKAMVPELEALYKSGDYTSLCYALNGTTSGDGYYGRYGTYGHYGHYGYYGHKGGSYYGSDKDS